MKVPPIKVYIKAVRGMGRGVFAAKDIKKSEIIEIAPILIFNAGYNVIRHLDLSHYWFKVGKKYSRSWGIALGQGSLYNHSFDRNAIWSINRKKETITFKALKNIKKDEQIFVDYGFPKECYKGWAT